MSWQNVVQTSRYETTTPNITALYRMESNGSATVGNDYSITNVGVGGSYTHSAQLKFGNCFKGSPTSGNAGYSYIRTTGGGSWASTMGWGTTKSWKTWFKVDSTTNATASRLFGFIADGSTVSVFFIGLATSQWNYLIVSLINESYILTLTSNVSLVDLNDGKEHCVEYVCSATNDHRLYLDGILHDSSSFNVGTLPAGNIGVIAAYAEGNGNGPWSGWIDEISCFTEAQTAKQAYAYGGALVC